METSLFQMGRKALSILCSVAICCAFSFPVEALAESTNAGAVANASEIASDANDEVSNTMLQNSAGTIRFLHGKGMAKEMNPL